MRPFRPDHARMETQLVKSVVGDQSSVVGWKFVGAVREPPGLPRIIVGAGPRACPELQFVGATLLVALI